MRKSIVWTTLLALAIIVMACDSGSSTQVADNDWSTEGLRGKVKSVTQRNYQAQNQLGGWVKGPSGQTYFIKRFTPEGFNETETTYYVTDNSIYGGTLYEYDGQGNLLKINRVGPDGGITSYTEITERQGKIRPLKFENYFVAPEENTLTGSSTMTWENGRVKESQFFNPNGIEVSKSGSTYDDNGHIAEFTRVSYEQNNSMTMKYTYLSYDEQGNWTSAVKEIVGMNYREYIERAYVYY